jgi:uncharacterized protein YkwD
MKRCLFPMLVLGLSGVLPFGNVAAQDKTKFMLTDDEQNIVDLTNQERKKHHLPALKVNLVLCQVARAHSANMATQNKMEHELDGKTPYDRIKGAGYKYSLAGENLARADVSHEEVMKAWMDSKVHRENILEGEFVETGVGIAKRDKGKVYYTQVFANPRE